ncbi:hypothetical protein BH24ACT1_BH24ACT1_09660 [soil metagenome]
MTEPVEDTSGRASARRLTWLRRLVWVVLLAGIVAFLVRGADNPEDPFLVPDGAGAEATTTPRPAPETEEAFPGSDDAATSSTATSTSLLHPPTTPTTARGSVAVSPGPAAVAGGTPKPAPASPAPVAPAPPTRRPLAGFDEVVFRITGPGGAVTDGVALLADDMASRSRGLMEQTDLRGYDAMVFRFSSPSDRRFYMRNTRIPLSIAFFGVNGRFISSADMQPCPDDVDPCPTTGANAPYLHAIEVAQGDLPGLGIGPGATLSFP